MDSFDSADEKFMDAAIDEALKAFNNNEVPVGAVVVSCGRVIGRGHNQTELLSDATAHAEMLAITSALEQQGSKYLDDCTLYVTLEPCAMCAGAISLTHIKRVVYGAADPKKGLFELREHYW